MVKKPLEHQIERIIEEPLPPGTAEHLDTFFEELRFDPYPNFDLTNTEDAARAAAYASEMLANLQGKVAQLKALEQMLITRSKEVKE